MMSALFWRWLMLRTEQVVDRLDRIECIKRNLNEHCIPVAHGPVPQTWKLECLQFAPILTLFTDKPSSRVYIAHQVKSMSPIILSGTHQIYGIKVSAIFEHLDILWI